LEIRRVKRWRRKKEEKKNIRKAGGGEGGNKNYKISPVIYLIYN
jgi:hypothetical protein